jgi:hypothetical protein
MRVHEKEIRRSQEAQDVRPAGDATKSNRPEEAA